MGIFDRFRKKKASVSMQNNDAKSEIYQRAFERYLNRTLSDRFASGVVFDFVRQNHDGFESVVRSKDMMGVQAFFVQAYLQFCSNSQINGPLPDHANDTDPRMWNMNVFGLETGEAIALCYMPIQDDTLSARIVGIALTDEGDRYFYCMLNKEAQVSSDVMQNKAWLGIAKVGEVKGSGFELMDSFLDVMKRSLYI